MVTGARFRLIAMRTCVPMSDPNHTGNVAESGFIFCAVRAGFSVLRPVTEHGAYDAALDVGGQLVRIQIKSGALDPDKGIIVARLRRARHSPTAGYIDTVYAPDEVDAFAIFCEPLERCFLIPVTAVVGQTTVQLRLGEAKNGQRASLRFATDYEFPGAVAQLGERSAGSRKVVGSNPISSISDDRLGAVAEAVGAHEFRNRFGWYMERAAAGEEIHVSRHGRPFVRLLPAADASRPLERAA